MAKINEVEIVYRNKYKDYYKEINKYFVKRKGTDKNYLWDDRCYVPIAAAIAELSQGSLNMRIIKSILKDAGIVASLCGWRANNKNIIKISEEKNQEILNLKVYEPIINIDDIFKKIGYGTYLEWNITSLRRILGHSKIDGILLSIEYDMNTAQLELRANIVLEDKTVNPFTLHLKDGHYLTECVEDTLHLTSKNIRSEIKNNKVTNIELIRTLKELEGKDRAFCLNYVLFSNVLFMLENI